VGAGTLESDGRDILDDTVGDMYSQMTKLAWMGLDTMQGGNVADGNTCYHVMEPVEEDTGGTAEQCYHCFPTTSVLTRLGWSVILRTCD
jgi:hypothetical protein